MERRAAFTLAELLVVVAIIAILAAILFPVFANSGDKSKKTSCLSNIKQQNLCILMYAQDYDEIFTPKMGDQMSVLMPYIKNEMVFRCPKVSKGKFGYAFHAELHGGKLYRLAEPASVPMLWDSLNLTRNATDPGISFAARHSGFGNVAFADGHARALSEEKGRSATFHELFWKGNDGQ